MTDDHAPGVRVAEALTWALEILGAENPAGTAVGVLFLGHGRKSITLGVPDDDRLRPVFEAQRVDGPALTCTRTGRAETIQDIGAIRNGSPALATAATDAGVRALRTVPMRIDTSIIGAFTVYYGTAVPALASRDRLVDALAHHLALARELEQRTTYAAELQTALNSRVIIEQAKGMLAERHRVDPDRAFARLRRFARDHNRKLHEVSGAIVRRELEIPDQDHPAVPHARAGSRRN